MIAKESDSIDKKYETKDDAQEKLKESKDYTDNSIAEIKVDSLYSPEAYYIADITQEEGKIKPIWQPLPFSKKAAGSAVYHEDTGNLVLPFNVIVR